jgi:inosose dehydratase
MSAANDPSRNSPRDLTRLTLGTAPDSWGMWFPDDPHQVTWRTYLATLGR